MAKPDRHALLQALKQHQTNRTLKELERLLEAWGWHRRETRKEGNLWRRGLRTMTLPDEKRLLPVYVSRAIHLIEAAAAEEGTTDE